MKSSGMVAPLLAGSVAARAMLDARALVGVDTSGAVCPAARADTVLVQPIFYSEFIPFNTVIDPFRNGRPVTVNNAPTPIITISDFRTTVLGGSVTLPGSNTVSPTPGGSTTSAGASATTTPGASGSVSGSASGSASGSTTDAGSASASITGTPTSATDSTTTTSTTSATSGVVDGGLSFADSGIPNGVVQDFPFLLLAFGGAGGAKRDLPHLKRQNTNPVNAVDLNGASNNAFSNPPSQCDSAAPLALVKGVLTNGNEVIAKLQQATEAAVGFLNPAVPGSVNGTFSLVDGLLNWAPTDGLPSATFYSCPDGVWAGFPSVGATRLASCVRVTAGAIAGAKCQQYIEQTQNRPVRGNFDQPSGSLIPQTSTSTTATTATSATDIVPVPTTSDVVPVPTTSDVVPEPITTAITTTTSDVVVIPTTTSADLGGAVI